MPLVLFSDGTSGNLSKKWHKFESWYLPTFNVTKMQHLRTKTLFAASTVFHPLSRPIAKELTLLETEGIIVFDKLYQEVVLVISFSTAIYRRFAKNPRALQLLNYLGSSATYLHSKTKFVDHYYMWVNCAPGKQLAPYTSSPI